MDGWFRLRTVLGAAVFVAALWGAHSQVWDRDLTSWERDRELGAIFTENLQSEITYEELNELRDLQSIWASECSRLEVVTGFCITIRAGIRRIELRIQDEQNRQQARAKMRYRWYYYLTPLLALALFWLTTSITGWVYRGFSN